LSLNKLPNDIRDEIRNNNRYALRELKEIAKKKTEKSQRAFFEKYKKRIAEKPSEIKSKHQNYKFDPEYHRVKLTKNIKYLSSLREPHKLALLRPLHHEMTELKNVLNELFNDLSIMLKNFDASKPVIQQRNSAPETLSDQPNQNEGAQ
jgi:23S rRNA G2069 N7-methylase RlmK/C1962 C5-methylase RlmI